MHTLWLDFNNCTIVSGLLFRVKGLNVAPLKNWRAYLPRDIPTNICPMNIHTHIHTVQILSEPQVGCGIRSFKHFNHLLILEHWQNRIPPGHTYIVVTMKKTKQLRKKLTVKYSANSHMHQLNTSYTRYTLCRRNLALAECALFHFLAKIQRKSRPWNDSTTNSSFTAREQTNERSPHIQVLFITNRRRNMCLINCLLIAVRNDVYNYVVTILTI